MKKFENIKNHIKATITKIKNYIKEKYNSKNTYKIIALCLFILNIVMSILLICTINTTSKLTKQLNDISKQNTSVTQISSVNTTSQDSIKSNISTSSEVKSDDKLTSSATSTSSKSTSSKSTSSKSTSSKTTSSKSSTSKTTNSDYSIVITDDSSDLELLACVIYQEAGGSCEDCLRRVADVVLNRVNSPKFPNTIRGVLTAKNQYGRFYYTGIKWPSRAKNYYEQKYVARAYRVAEEVLNGQHSELYGKGYVWQAAFKQGSSQIKCCGEYFGK